MTSNLHFIPFALSNNKLFILWLDSSFVSLSITRKRLQNTHGRNKNS